MRFMTQESISTLSYKWQQEHMGQWTMLPLWAKVAPVDDKSKSSWDTSGGAELGRWTCIHLFTKNNAYIFFIKNLDNIFNKNLDKNVRIFSFLIFTSFYTCAISFYSYPDISFSTVVFHLSLNVNNKNTILK